MMRTFKKDNSGLSILEVLISALIFVIAAVGTYSVLISSRQSSTFSTRKLQAAYYGRQLFDELRAKVDQENWASWYLNCDNAWHTWPDAPSGSGYNSYFFNSFNATAYYQCADDPPESGAVNDIRKVTINVQWDE